MGNMLWVVENGKEMAENEWDAKPTIRPFYKAFGRGRRFGPNGIETGVHKFFFEFQKIEKKWLKTSETQSPPFGHFIKTLGEAVN